MSVCLIVPYLEQCQICALCYPLQEAGELSPDTHIQYTCALCHHQQHQAWIKLVREGQEQTQTCRHDTRTGEHILEETKAATPCFSVFIIHTDIVIDSKSRHTTPNVICTPIVYHFDYILDI